MRRNIPAFVYPSFKCIFFWGMMYVVCILLSCSPSVKYTWVTSDNGFMIWVPEDSLAVYSWDGGHISNVIHGQGTLTVKRGDDTQVHHLTSYYGALSKDDAKKISPEEFYVGEVKNRTFSGFGVLVKGTDIFNGTFKDGQPHGFLTWYRNGKVYYEGEWSDGAFNGVGILCKGDGTCVSGIWESGKLISADVSIDTEVGKYEGQVTHGKPNGYGILSYKSGFEYAGNWENGLWNGIGLLAIKQDTVISEWVNGVASGHTIIITNDYQYDGQYKDNLPDGRGSFYYLNPDAPYTYAGEWKNGKRNGYGDVFYPNGDAYFGEWVDDQYFGVGRYRYSNGDVYDGEWENNLPSGKGEYIAPEFRYGGEWLEGWIHGFGRIDFKNGDIYEGDFAQGEKCGQGLYQFANGNVYEGEFFNDQINGLGVITFADGNRYEGEFANGKVSGNGTFYYADSTGVVTFTAFWDKPNEFPSEASIIFPNGDIYNGPLLNGEPTNDGVWYKYDKATGEATVAKQLTDINVLYKQHRETWNRTVVFASVALSVIEVGGTIAAPFTGAGSLIIVQVARAANIALNIADAGVGIGSATIDYATAETKDDLKDASKNLGKEIGLNVAAVLVPKALQTPFMKKTMSKLSESALNIVKKPLQGIAKQKGVSKVIRVVKEQKQKLKLALEKTKVGRVYYRITGKASYQYVPDEQAQKMIKRNPNTRVFDYNPDAVGDARVLGKNALASMPDKAKKRYNAERRIMGSKRAQWHHVIAGNMNNPSAEGCRNILKKYKIDINDPRNAILLPVDPNSIMKGTLHGKHMTSYDDYVYGRLKQAKTREQCLEVMDDIKKELYNGRLQLLRQHRVNTALGSVIKSSKN